MPKLIETQYIYKKQFGFTLQQKRAFKIMKEYGVNISQFARAAIDEKLKRDWPSIKEKHNRINDAPDWVYE
jgi:hypothetical protein